MSGGHWNYPFSGDGVRLSSERMQDLFRWLEAAEHALDWGLSGDTCPACAEINIGKSFELLMDRWFEHSVSMDTVENALDLHSCPICSERYAYDETHRTHRHCVAASPRLACSVPECQATSVPFGIADRDALIDHLKNHGGAAPVVGSTKQVVVGAAHFDQLQRSVAALGEVIKAADGATLPDNVKQAINEARCHPACRCILVGNLARWAPVEGASMYEVSTDGQVFNVDKVHMLSVWKNHHGYACVTLTMDTGRRTSREVHLLVLSAFAGKRPAGMHGSHINGDPMDASLSNLCWETPQQNEARKRLHGTATVGERNGRAKLTHADVLAMRASNEPNTHLAKRYGVTHQHVALVRAGHVWKV